MELAKIFLVLVYHASALASTADVHSGSGQGRELHVLLMTSSAQRFNSSGAETAVRLALDRVNKDASISPGYELQLAGVRDTKVRNYRMIYTPVLHVYSCMKIKCIKKYIAARGGACFDSMHLLYN